MGTKKWDGLPLYGSYRTFIGNREIELDSEIPRSELPAIVGSSIEPPVDPEFGSLPASQPPTSFLLDARRTPQQGTSSSPSANSPASAKRFIPPSSFYGTSTEPKPKGPLYASFCL